MGTDVGVKLDAGKPRMDLVLKGFGKALQAVAEVGTFGAQKYTDNGWQLVPNGQERYSDALLRHYLASEAIDPESGYHHDIHVAWNALARLNLRITNDEDTENT